MGTNLRILLIEDDADDIELLEEALRVNNITYDLDVVMDGDKVAPYLLANPELPEVIVLDFNLPRVHGREVLALIKASLAFNKIPLIVLTTSAAKEDIQFALNMGALHFLTKPTSIDGFKHTVDTIITSARQR